MEQAISTPPKKEPFAWLRKLFNSLAENPIIIKEFRKQMRGRQAFFLLIAYLGLISIFIAMIYAFVSLNGGSSQWDPGFRQNMGKAIFGTVVLLELTFICFIAPALTSGAIAAERERQTFELLRTTLLSARALVLGKLGSALSFIFLLIFAALPLESLAFLLGGVGLAELLVSSLMLVVTAFFFCTLGLFASSLVKRTSIATVISYATIIVSTLFLGLTIFILAAIYSRFSNSGWPDEILNIVLWFLISTNPLLAAIFSEMLLIESQALFFTSNPPFGSTFIFVPSPWIIFTLIYLILACAMLLLSIHFVGRPER